MFVPPLGAVVAVRVPPKTGYRLSLKRGVRLVACRVLSEPIMSAYGQPFIWLDHPFNSGAKLPWECRFAHKLEVLAS